MADQYSVGSGGINDNILLPNGVQMVWIQAGLFAAILSLSSCVAYDIGAGKVQHKWDLDKLERTSKQLEREAEYRRKEKQWASSYKMMIDRLQADERSVRESYESTIADINDGTLVLRQHYQSCQQRLSQASTPSGGADGGDREGLLERDRERLLRIGADCNLVKSKLHALQDYVRPLVE